MGVRHHDVSYLVIRHEATLSNLGLVFETIPPTQVFTERRVALVRPRSHNIVLVIMFPTSKTKGSRRPQGEVDSLQLFGKKTDLEYDSPADTALTTRPSTINVVLFGETGVGKSSVINLIAQKVVAQVSSDVDGCTMQSTRYLIPFDGTDFAIFDTIGLEEPQYGVNGYLKAIEKAYELIMKLSTAGGIHLLLFCMRGGRITATTQSNYRLFCECLCSTRVPIALVFTGLEREEEMENWWTRNKSHIEHYGIKSQGHACITAVKDDTPGEDLKFTESQKRIRELLKGCALRNDDAFMLDAQTWFTKLGRMMKSFIAKGRNPKRKDVMKVLTQRCKLDQDTAKKIAEMMEKDDPETKDAANVVLFGETSAEKNSVINLIAQKVVAHASPSIDGRTMQSTQYLIPVDGINFAISDTVDLEGLWDEEDSYLKAIERTHELITKLSAAGGIHLFLFCMRGRMITTTMQSNYRLFCESLCSAKVPIALVFTGLEQEEDTENWWARNKSHIEGYGIKSSGHACITAVKNDSPGEDLKFMESQGRIRELLKSCALKDDPFVLDTQSWLAQFGGGIKNIAKRGSLRKDIVGVLTQRYKLDHDAAKEIVVMMEKTGSGTKGALSSGDVLNDGRVGKVLAT